MTGWQGAGGNQDENHGAWGPPGTEPYGQDPYYLQPDPYGYPGYPPPPPPPPRSKLPMIFGVLAIVLIVGAVITIVLVNRESGGTPTAGPTSSTETPRSRAPQPPASSRPSSDPSSSEPDAREGWQTIDNTADSGLIYEVPPDWKVVPGSRPSGLGVEFTGTADYGTYQCEERTYVRSYATSGDVQAKDGADLELAETVRDFAAGFGKEAFGETARVSVPEPEEFELNGRPAARVAAKVTPQVTVPACQASEGEVAIVGVLLREGGKPTGVAMLTVVSDVAGGPADPASLPKTVAQEVLASLTVS